jgi:hypothetical protein
VFVPLLLAIVLLLALAQTAAAAPPEPTLDLEQLRAALESGPLSGHLLTTMRGTTPEEIPVTVESLVDYSWGTLILFEATGPQIDRIGGIAAGMSGSPIYVDDAGTDKLVGALSYGDWFTLNGMGLATPIEYMAAIEENYPVGALASLQAPRSPAAGTYALDEPVATSGGVVRSVVVTRSATAAAKVEASDGQTVMAPLGILEIGGARPGSKAFDRIAAKFAKSGLLIKAASGSGTWAGPPVPALEAGSPCAILFSQGAVWAGAAGTVTYVDDDAAMLFGHPFQQFGAIDAALTGGYVEGVWASSNTPYKLIAPRDVKGTCVQDRNWGVEAHLSQTPDAFPVTTTANLVDRSVSVQDDSDVSQWLVTSGAYPTLPGDIVGDIVYRAVDQMGFPGSAATTTTVVVSDATGTYTVQHDNVWTSSWDISYQTGRDASSALMQLAANPDGVLQPRIESVEVVTDVSATQLSARIEDVTLPDGIKVGDNRVRIEYYRYGSATPQTIEGTLTIPEGMSLYGRLTVTPASWDQWGGGWCCCCRCGDGGGGGGGAPRMLADLVENLNALPKNSDLLLSFEPYGSSSDSGDEGEETGVETTVPTDYIFNSYFSKRTARVMVEAQPAKVPYGGATQVMGMVRSSEDVQVSIYRQNVDAATAVFVGKVKATAKRGYASFRKVVPGLTKNAEIIARTEATANELPGGASADVKVSARIWLSGTSRLTVHVKPGDASGTARLQLNKNGRWVSFRTVRIKSGEGTTGLPKGTHTLRVRFSGSDLCAATTSRSFTITVR